VNVAIFTPKKKGLGDYAFEHRKAHDSVHCVFVVCDFNLDVGVYGYVVFANVEWFSNFLSVGEEVLKLAEFPVVEA